MYSARSSCRAGALGSSWRVSMSNTARQRLFIASAFVSMVVFGIVAHANNWWGGYHWARTANPFTVPLGDKLTTTDWKSHLSQASSDWSKSSLLDTAIV